MIFKGSYITSAPTEIQPMSNAKRSRYLLLMLIALLAGGKVIYSQSLAELAKKEKERRAQSQAPIKVRVLSNSDVAKFQKGAVSTGTYGQEPAKSVTSTNLPEANAAPAAVAQEVADQAKDEKYWRGRFKELTDGQKASENKFILAQLQLNELRNRFYRESDGFYRETIQKDIDLKIKELDRLEKESQGAQKQLEDFKKEARQKNVPPGWIR
jgi:hypothetical protein